MASRPNSSYAGAMRSSTTDSGSPAILSTAVSRATPPERAASHGSRAVSMSPSSSVGTPGNRNRVQPSLSKRMPGAVPRALGRTSAPCTTCACRRLTSGMRQPSDWKRRSRSASTAASGWSPRPRAAATASRVTSSAVGPSPPVTRMRSTRGNRARNSPATSSSESPITALRRSSAPWRARSPVRRSELVSSRSVPSSSDPTARMAAFMPG